MNINVDLIYDQIRKMEVSLEEQNYANHHYYQKVLTKCDLYVSLLSKHYTMVRQECSKIQVQYNIQAEEIETKRRHHIANNTEIQKRYSTGRERELAVDDLLRSDISDLKKKDNNLILLRDLAGVLNTWLSIMRERKRDAKEQWKILCEQNKASNMPDPTDKDVQELNKVIGELEQEAAESMAQGGLDFNEEIVSEEYIEESEEAEEDLNSIENGSVNTESHSESIDDLSDIEIAPGLTGPDSEPSLEDSANLVTAESGDEAIIEGFENNSESDSGSDSEDSLDNDSLEDSANLETAEPGDEGDEEDDEGPDILDMLTSVDASEEDEPENSSFSDIESESNVESSDVIDTQKDPDEDITDDLESDSKELEETITEPISDDSSDVIDTQKDPDEDNSDEIGLEDDLLKGLDDIDESILAGIPSPSEEPKKTKSKKSKKAEKALDTKTEVNIDLEDSTPSEDKVSKKEPKKVSKATEDEASRSEDVDIDDILGELDGL